MGVAQNSEKVSPRSTQVRASRMDRRSFIGKASKVAAGALAVGTFGLGIRDEYKAGKKGYEAASDKVSAATDEVKGFFGQGREEVSSNPIEASASKPPVETDFTRVFPGLTDEKKYQAFERVRQGGSVVLENMNTDQLRDVLRVEGLIRETARKYQIPENLLLGLVIVESKGDPLAQGELDEKTGEIAKGLTQMEDAMAQRYKLKISDGDDDERFNPEKILAATCQELAERQNIYGSLVWALWEWHAGAPNLLGFIRTYFSSRGKELPDLFAPLPDVPEAEATAQAQANLNEYKAALLGIDPKTGEKIGKEVTIFDVLSVVEEAANAEGMDKDGEYVYRILGASMVFNAMKAELGE